MDLGRDVVVECFINNFLDINAASGKETLNIPLWLIPSLLTALSSHLGNSRRVKTSRHKFEWFRRMLYKYCMYRLRYLYFLFPVPQNFIR